MAKVNPNLYDFLINKTMETGMFYDRDRKIMVAYAHIYFFYLEDFVKLLGSSYFDEAGMNCILFNNTICMELQDIFESEDNTILDYKNCFKEDDIENFKEYLLMEN